MVDLKVMTAEEAAQEQAAGGCCDPVCGPETCGTSAEASATEATVALKAEEKQPASGCGPSTCR